MAGVAAVVARAAHDASSLDFDETVVSYHEDN